MDLPGRFWRDMTTRAFNETVCRDWIAVLPIAAIEQHGPHLPVGVDALIAEAMVTRAAVALPTDAPVTFLPVQQVCKSNEHIAFPGTLTVDWEVVIKTWLQIGHSVARAGVRKLVIITSHGGNVAPMDIVARELRQTHTMAVVTTAWARLGARRVADDPKTPMIDIHAGFYETSMMLALYPDLVDMDLAQDFSSRQTALRQGARHLGYHMAEANLGWLAQDLNDHGAVGNARAATAEAGARMIEDQIAGFVALMHDMGRYIPPYAGKEA